MIELIATEKDMNKRLVQKNCSTTYSTIMCFDRTLTKKGGISWKKEGSNILPKKAHRTSLNKKSRFNSDFLSTRSGT